MKQKLITILTLSVAFLSFTFFSGCKKGCTNPLAENYDAEASKDDGSCEFITEAPFAVEINHKAGTEDFAFNTTYQTADGRDYQFTEARLYLTALTTTGDVGTVNFEDTYALVTTDVTSYPMGNLDVGNYTALTVAIGVDSAANHTDPSTYELGHPLGNQTPNMNWNWASGYIFIMIEGKVDTTVGMNGAIDGNFVMHVGMDNFLREATLTKNFEVSSTGGALRAELDWATFLDGIDLRTENSTHTMDNMPLAMKVANNAPNILTPVD